MAELRALERPAAGEAEGALVLLHGRGADEHDLFPLLDALDPERSLLGLAPRGPLSLPPGGAHWYELGEMGRPPVDTFFPTFKLASEWLDGIGVPIDRTIVGGFSQGAMMAYTLGLGAGRPRPAGIIALSGFLPEVDGFEYDLSPPLPPIAIAHGMLDPVIDVEWGRRARAQLEAAGAKVLYRESPIPHTIDPAFLMELRPWISDALSPASPRAD
jgi:phospholipase/carboxylesterase